MLAMIAGADTVTSTLTSLFALLRAHPAAYARLEGEVDGVLPPGEDEGVQGGYRFPEHSASPGPQTGSGYATLQ